MATSHHSAVSEVVTQFPKQLNVQHIINSISLPSQHCLCKIPKGFIFHPLILMLVIT